MCHRRQDQGSGRLDTAHDFNDDIGATGRDGRRVGREQVGGDTWSGLAGVAHRHGYELNGGTDALCEVRGVLGEEPGHLSTHASAPEEGDTDRGHGGKPLRSPTSRAKPGAPSRLRVAERGGFGAGAAPRPLMEETCPA